VQVCQLFVLQVNFSKNKVDYIDNGNTKVTSTNTLLGNVQGVDGLKTGYHDAAGSNIVLTANRGDDRMIAVILGSNHAKDRNAIGAREINDYYNFRFNKNGHFLCALHSGFYSEEQIFEFSCQVQENFGFFV